MSEMPLRILLIEDDYLLVREYLGETDNAALALEWAATYEAGLAALARREHDVALVDYRLGAQNGLELLHAAGAAGDLPPTIVLTGTGDPAVDAAAQAAGASDYLVKGRLDAPTLERAIRYTLAQSRQRTALAESQQFLQATLDALSAHIAVLDERGVVVAANAAWRRYAGQNKFPDEGYGLGMDYLAVCDVGARAGAVGAAEVGAALRDILAGRGTSFVREDPCHGPHDRRWFVIRISRFPGNGPIRAVIAHENVTERHLAEEQTRFQAQLLDQVPAAVIATDPAGIVTHWNAHATALYGWTPEETLGRSAEMLIAGPPDAGLGRALVERVTAGEVWAGEFPVRRKDGASFPAYVTDSALRDEQGRLAGIVGVSVDISARKEAEAALVASEGRYRMLLEQASDGIVVMDPTARFVEANAQACIMLGYAREELLALSSPEVIDPADLSTRPLVFPESGPTPTVFERRLRRRDGTTFPAEASIKRLPDGGTQVILRDITARKAAEAELREVLTHARCLLWRAEITERPGAALADDSEQFSWSLHIADEAAAQHVLPLDVPPGGDYAGAWHISRYADDFARSDATSAQALRQGAPGYRQEFRCRNRHGGEQWLAEEVTLEAIGPGRWRAVGICVDITERKVAEAGLRANEARFRALVQQLDDVIAITDAEGILRYASPAIERTLGYTPEAFVGTSIFPYLHPDDHATVTATFRQTLANPGIPMTVTYRARHRDGSWRWFETNGTNLLDEPAVAGVVINARDITARIEADEALRQGAESFATLFEATGDGIIIIEEGRIAAINRAYTALMGYEPDDLIGRPVLDIVAPDERALIAARIAANHDQPYEIRQLRKDGSAFLAEVVGRSIRYHGRPARLSTIRDITARKHTADALRADAARRQALIKTQHAVAAARLDQDTLMQVVIGHAQALTGADGAMIELLEGEELVCRAACGAATALVGLRLAIGQSLSGRCVQTGEAQRCDDAERDERVERSAWEVGEARSMLVVPLRYDGRTFGVLKVLTKRPAAFAAGDQETLELLAGVGGAALSHAAAYEEQRALASALRASESGLEEAQRLAHLGSWEYDINADRLTWSDEVFRIGGFVPQSFLPTPERLQALIHPDDRARVAQAQRAVLAEGASYDLYHRIVRPDGEIRTVHQQAERVLDAAGRPLKRVGIVQDVTERRALEEQLRHQAFHDALTGLPNRALLFERIGQALARARRDGRPCAVLFLDLDRFKDVNDTVGHDAGDRLLVAVAARLGGALRDGDTLARLGGDEFTILLEDVADPNEAACAATRLLDTLASPLVIDGQEYRLTASIGLALGRPDHHRAEDVLRDADIAMYRAKEGGRANYAVFDPKMQAQIVARLEMERDLRRALEQGEFLLHYQPIVDLRTGDMAKVEALVRWQHPERGLVSPGVFIPLAEETGLIRALGRWVLGEACRQAQVWQASGTPVAIAVNLTALEFQHPDLADEVAAALAMAGIDARWLRLEITESLAMRDVAATITTLGLLRAMGVAIAIDDFGTGYSSLAYLKRLPVSALKIDKAFIDGLGTDEEDTAIVTAIVTLGHTLGLRVIAEGVETAEQAGLLRALGCDQAQGYHFARPLPAAALGLGMWLEREMVQEDMVTRARPTTGALRQRHATTLRHPLPDSGD